MYSVNKMVQPYSEGLFFSSDRCLEPAWQVLAPFEVIQSSVPTPQVQAHSPSAGQ